MAVENPGDHQRWPPALASPAPATLNIVPFLLAVILFLCIAIGYVWYRGVNSTPPTPPAVSAQPAPTPPQPSPVAFDPLKAFTEFSAREDHRPAQPKREAMRCVECQHAVTQECGYISKASKLHPPVCNGQTGAIR